MNRSGQPIRALGEIALRVNDLDAMQAFYADVIGLELMRRFPRSVFFKIAEGYAGHTQILALFDRSGADGAPPNCVSAERSTIDHIAFTISAADHESTRARLEKRGLEVTTTEHAWVQWRSIYVCDPEGNMVEFVCFDETIVQETA